MRDPSPTTLPLPSGTEQATAELRVVAPTYKRSDAIVAENRGAIPFAGLSALLRSQPRASDIT